MGPRIVGCWTCRLRHRKCDLESPACRECSDRHVECHGYGPKPSWMDGADEEERERSRIKTAIKDNFRRIRRLQNLALRKEQRQSIRLSGTRSKSPTISTTPCAASPSDGDHHSTLPNDAEDNELSQPEVAGFLMHYLDRVFPWQFPYHRSDSRLGNRGWLLMLLMKRGPLYHAALSLSALHQSALNGCDEEYWQNQKAFDHHSKALRQLCEFISREQADEVLGGKAKLVEFLACSVLLISFEILRGGEHDWQPHLHAVTAILASTSPDDLFGPHITHEGLEFLVACVLWFDIFACVATGKPPHLPHQHWLGTRDLNMVDVMGCQDWVLLAIGDLALLRQWKETKQKEGVLSVRELASRGQDIEARLETGLDRMAERTAVEAEVHSNWVTHIFTLAALVLLHTIVSGPLPALPEIQNTVSRGIVALQNVPRGCSFGGIVWPLCVLGCMADPAAQAFFEDLMTSLVRDSGRFGNCATVFRIMKKCWSMQESSHKDLTTMMSEMGICALLI